MIDASVASDAIDVQALADAVGCVDRSTIMNPISLQPPLGVSVSPLVSSPSREPWIKVT